MTLFKNIQLQIYNGTSKVTNLVLIFIYKTIILQKKLNQSRHNLNLVLYSWLLNSFLAYA